jgi:hypothetical protein
MGASRGHAYAQHARGRRRSLPAAGYPRPRARRSSAHRGRRRRPRAPFAYRTAAAGAARRNARSTKRPLPGSAMTSPSR